MAKRKITDKRRSARYEMNTSNDMILVDEYPDGTYRLFIPGDYQKDEVDEDFATVDGIRQAIGLIDGDKKTELEAELEDARREIRELRVKEEGLVAALGNVVDIKEVVPEITERGKALLDGMLRIIERNDSYLHKIWSDVRSVGLNENGVQMMGPYPVIPDREEDGEESE